MPLPDRWLDYSPIGHVIPGTKFLAFKVPLKKALLFNVEKHQRFSPDHLIADLEKRNLKLRMIIDLTFTRKYYVPQDFEKHSIIYKKIFVQGAKSGKTIPDDSNFLEFAQAVQRHGTEDSVIGVHCTHGLNRTGYMICRYMIEEMNFEPDDAIRLFNDARGHTMERETYLSDLRRRKKGVSTLGDISLAMTEQGAETIQESKRNVGPFLGKAKKQRWRHKRYSHHEMRHKEHQHCLSQDSSRVDIDQGNEVNQSWPRGLPPGDKKEKCNMYPHPVNNSSTDRRGGFVRAKTTQCDLRLNRNLDEPKMNRERWRPNEFHEPPRRSGAGQGHSRGYQQGWGISSYQSADWSSSGQNSTPNDDGYGKFGHRDY